MDQTSHDARMGRSWHLEDHVAVRAKCDEILGRRRQEPGVYNEHGNLVCNYGQCRRSAYRDGLCKGHWGWNEKRRNGKRKRGGVPGLRIGPQRRNR